MSALGSMVVSLALEYAQYTAALSKSEQAALEHTKRVQDTFDGIKNGLIGTATAVAGGIAAAFTIGAFKQLIGDAVASGAALNDMAIQTGASVEALSALADVGKYSDQTLESIGHSMGVLTRNLASSTEESKGAAAALDAMGLSLDDFRQLKPEDQMQAVAKSLDGFQDGAGKAAVMMALFGKEGAKMLPFMQDLASVGELQARITTEQAAAADSLDDNWKKLTTTGGETAKEVAMGMVPALDESVRAMIDVMAGSSGIREALRGLVADGSIERWTRTAVIGLSYVVDAATYAWRAFEAVGKALGGSLAAAVLAGQGEFKLAMNALSETGRDMVDTFTAPTLGQKFRESMDVVRAAAGETAADLDKPKLAFVNLATDAKKATDEIAKAVERGRDLAASLLAQESGLSGDFSKKWDDLSIAYTKGAISIEVLTQAQAVLLGQQPLMKKAAEDRAKLEKQINDETAKALEEAWKQVDAIGAQAKSQEMANATFGQGKTALAELTLAEMENQRAALEATENVIPGYVQALESRIAAQKRLIKAMKDGEVLDANEKAAKKAADEWERTAGKINDSITDALMRGFESGKDFAINMRDTIVNMFKTMVLRPVVQAIVSPVGAGVASAFGVSGAQASSISGSSLGMIGTIKSVYDNIVGGFSLLGDKVAFAAEDIGAWLVNNTTGVLNQAGSSLMSSAGALGTAVSYAGGALAGYGIGKTISGQYTTGLGKNTLEVGGTVLGAILGGPIGAAIGGAIGGLINRAFGTGPKETQDFGLSGQFSATGANVSQFSRWHQEGGWFRSDRSGTDFAAVNAELGKFLNGAVGMTTSATKAYASAIGLSADAVNGFSQSISISLKGLDEAAQEKAIAAAITGFGDAMAKSAYGATLALFAKESEAASVTLARLGNSLMTVNQVLDTLNQNLLATSALGADAASKLLDLVGGTEAFATLTTAYYQSIYTEEERLAKTREQLGAAFASVFAGASLPQTLASYKDLVDAQDLNTEVGRQQYAVLLQLAPAFADVTKRPWLHPMQRKKRHKPRSQLCVPAVRASASG